MKKSLQAISGHKLALLIDEKVTDMAGFCEEIGLSRQYINRIIKKEKVRVGQKAVENIKNYLNVTTEEIKYVPRETISKQNGARSDYPVSSSILEELEACRKDVAYWKGLAREYEDALNKLRGQQQ